MSQTGRSRQTSHLGRPRRDIMSQMGRPVWDILFWLSWIGRPISDIMSWTGCPGYHIQNRTSHLGRPIQDMMSHLGRPIQYVPSGTSYVPFYFCPFVRQCKTSGNHHQPATYGDYCLKWIDGLVIK